MSPRLIKWSVLVAGVFAVVAAASSTASAQADWSVHGRIATLTGWTDNINLAPENDPVIAPPESDFFFNLRPGMLVSRSAPRSIHSFSYEFNANLNVEHTEANDFSHRVDWNGFFRTGPRSSMITSVAGQIGDTGNLVIAGDASAGDPDFLPDPGQTFHRVDASEVLRYQLNADWRSAQTLNAAFAETFEEGNTITRTGTASLGLSGDRVWSSQTVGLAGNVEVINLETPLISDEASRQLTTTLEGGYRRDFNENWSANGFAGATLVTPLSDDGESGIHPVFQLGAFYRHDIGFGSLRLTREIAPVMFAATTSINETAALNVGVPLPWLAENPTEPVLFLASSVATGRTRQLDTAGDPTSGWYTILADGGIFYTNRDPRVSIGLRYAYNQRIDVEDAISEVTEFRRHTVMFTIGGMWPSRPAGVVPVRGGVRVDQSDTDPTADEDEATNAASTRGGS
jgi:hypothetical protein